MDIDGLASILRDPRPGTSTVYLHRNPPKPQRVFAVPRWTSPNLRKYLHRNLPEPYRVSQQIILIETQSRWMTRCFKKCMIFCSSAWQHARIVIIHKQPYRVLRKRFLMVSCNVSIGSMYGIYANIGGILVVNVTIYGIHTDPMG